jgi:hypothetical protein
LLTLLQSYSLQDHKDEFGLLIDAMNADSNIPNKNLLIGPNLAGVWSLPDIDIWQTGSPWASTKTLLHRVLKGE